MPLVWRLPVRPGILQGQDVAWKQRSPFRSGATSMLAPCIGGPGLLPRMSWATSPQMAPLDILGLELSWIACSSPPSLFLDTNQWFTMVSFPVT